MPDRSASFTAQNPQPNEPGVQERASVLLPLPLGGAYDYGVPDGMSVEPGSFVRVPLGTRSVAAVVWDPPEGEAEPIAAAKVKPIEAVYDVPPMQAMLRRLVDWIAAYTVAPRGAVLRMAMGPADALVPPEPRRCYALPPSLPADAKLTPARRRVVAVLSDGLPRPSSVLAFEAGCSAAVLRGMVAAGLLAETPVAPLAPRPIPDGRRPFPILSPAQHDAAAAIDDAIRARRYHGFLLDGVTGSGKTEVYFKAIATALAEDRQILVLLPEIALGAQWHQRFERQFGCPAAGWHSGVGGTERRFIWRDVRSGRAKVVVGARSALFLPFHDLGLIVVDEEHDGSYKQEDGVVYHARDMAVVRASLAQIPIVLASATPSLESLVNAERGRYTRLVLPSRHGGARLPEIASIDLRRDKPARHRFLAPKLVAALAQSLEQGEQAMLFLNRRGYAPLTLCRSCGHRLNCPNCTAWLVEHRFRNRLICHHCGHAQPLPETCPACSDRQSLAPCGPGVERVAEEISALFPEARVAVMASDTLIGPQALGDLIARVEAHELDLLIGTQIMAKGHHFPMLTLVGVVDADLGLNGGDLRAAERTYQLLHQIAGRAGRAERPGRVLLQTYDPEHPVMQALIGGERDRFLELEAEGRSRHGWPPYGRLAALIVSAGETDEADLAAAALARAAPHLRGLSVLGPAPAPLAILRGRHRRRFLLKTERGVNIQAVLRQWVGAVKLPSSVKVQIDVDPYSFL
jgi:primosomal protein N' (replication factor Y)